MCSCVDKKTGMSEPEKRPDRVIFDRTYFKEHSFRWKLACMIRRIFRIKMPRCKAIVRSMRPLTDDECIDLFREIPLPVRSGPRLTDVFSKLDWESYQNENPVYLDVGCHDGSLTRQISEHVSAATAIGVDVTVPAHIGRNSSDNVVLMEYDGMKLPFSDDSFDLVTCFQTLHHVSDVGTTCSEIMRVLKPGGLLLIKEHNCDSEETRKLIEIEHLLWSIKNNDYEVQNCKSLEEWDQVLGTRIWTFIYENDPTGIYYALYTK